MKRKYKGIIEDVYRFEAEVEAESGDEAIQKLKELRKSDAAKNDFTANENSYAKSQFALKS